MFLGGWVRKKRVGLSIGVVKLEIRVREQGDGVIEKSIVAREDA